MPEQISINSKIITGIATRTTNKHESNPETASIPGLWSRFYAENIGGQGSSGSTSDIVYGVYTDYESDHNGAYTLIIGKESNTELSDHEVLVSKRLSAGEYLKFERRGKLLDAVIETWKEIWAYFEGAAEYERVYTADFEEYTSEEGVCIYVAVKRV